jgi:hypothetical protein
MLQEWPHHFGDAADLGVVPEFLPACAPVAETLSQSVDGHFQADFVAELEAIRRLGDRWTRIATPSMA